MNGEGLLSLGFFVFVLYNAAELSKGANRIECEIGCLVWSS